jgi:hypothetical protein
MSPVKKLIFAPLFLISITASIYFYKLILDQYLNVFFGNLGGLYEFSLLAIPLVLASLFYCLFITFTQNFKYAAGLAAITALTPFAFLSFNLSLVIAAGLGFSLIFAYFNLETNLRSYLNFQPSTLLISPIKMLNTFLLLTLAFGFFLNANAIIQRDGFKIPDTLIDWAVNMSLSSSQYNFKGDKRYLAQSLTPEQIELLKQNPGILKQYGLTPEDLDALTTPKQAAPATQQGTITATPLPPGNLKEVLKNQINGMVDQMLKPYLFVIPILLAFMFYSLASLILWLFSFFLSPILALLFYVFEKSGFVKYEKEMREVKKIII